MGGKRKLEPQFFNTKHKLMLLTSTIVLVFCLHADTDNIAAPIRGNAGGVGSRAGAGGDAAS